MYILYIIVIILFLYYTGLYTKLPDPVPGFFEKIGKLLPGSKVNNDITGIYESTWVDPGGKDYILIGKKDDGSLFVISNTLRMSTSSDDPLVHKTKVVQKLKLDYSNPDSHRTPFKDNGDGTYTLEKHTLTKSGSSLQVKDNESFKKIMNIDMSIKTTTPPK